VKRRAQALLPELISSGLIEAPHRFRNRNLVAHLPELISSGLIEAPLYCLNLAPPVTYRS